MVRAPDAAAQRALLGISGGGTVPDEWVFVSSLADLPTPSGEGVITLEANRTYVFTTVVDLLGNRLVAGANTTILGGSSENCRIKSTGLSSAPLLFSTYSLPMRNITLEAPAGATAILLVAGSPNQALDWFGVNFTDTADIGVIADYNNVIWSDCAVLNSAGLLFDGTISTIGFSQCIFQGPGTASTIVSFLGEVTRRIRFIYSAVVAFGGDTGIHVDLGGAPPAIVPNEGFILDTVNFSGKPPSPPPVYITGIDYTSNKALWVNCRGVTNTAVLANYYMQDNATVTDITASTTPIKVAGTTSGNALTQRFTLTDNRATYTGAFTRDVKCLCTATITGTSNHQIGLYFAKNGTVIDESETYVTMETSGRKENITVQTIAQVAENDYIEVWVENGTANADVTVVSLNVAIEGLN